jgi:hypothetical protein
VKRLIIYTPQKILLWLSKQEGEVGEECVRRGRGTFRSGSLKGRDHLIDLGVDGRIMLKWISN